MTWCELQKIKKEEEEKNLEKGMGGVGSGQFGPLEAFNIQQFIYLKGKSINNGQIGFVHYGWP